MHQILISLKILFYEAFLLVRHSKMSSGSICTLLSRALMVKITINIIRYYLVPMDSRLPEGTVLTTKYIKLFSAFPARYGFQLPLEDLLSSFTMTNEIFEKCRDRHIAWHFAWCGSQIDIFIYSVYFKLQCTEHTQHHIYIDSTTVVPVS